MQTFCSALECGCFNDCIVAFRRERSVLRRIGYGNPTRDGLLLQWAVTRVVKLSPKSDPFKNPQPIRKLGVHILRRVTDTQSSVHNLRPKNDMLYSWIFPLVNAIFL